MKNLYITEGGLGKNILFTALIPSLCKKDESDKISVVTPWPCVFMFNEQIENVDHFDRQFGWMHHEHFEEYDNILYHEPYFSNYIKDRDLHIIDDWAKGYNIPPVPHKPYLPSVDIPDGHTFYTDSVSEPCAPPQGKYCIVQFTGGYGRLGDYIQTPRDYRLDYAQKLVYKIKKKLNIDVICFRTEGESKPADTMTFYPKIQDGMLNMLSLINDSEFVITIDSALKHFCACTDKKSVIALYNLTQTLPQKIGYNYQINLTCENNSCIDIDPDIILETIEKSQNA